jgi:CRP-like cAMP-binding protein
MDDLDFSQPKKPQPAPQAPREPLYVPAIARAFFESVGKQEIVPAGTKIFQEHDKASRILLKRDKMYLLVEGDVVLIANGKPLGVVKPGEIFGEMAAITESPRSATALTRSACRVMSLDDKQFLAALRQKPEFALMLLALMIQRLRGMLAAQTGFPSATGPQASPRVIDKGMLETLEAGLGDTAIMRYDRGKVILVQGQVGAFMYVVLEGRVAITLRGATVERLGPGGVFGEMALIDHSTRAANAAAEADCVLLAINRPMFMNLIKTDPDFGVSLLSAVAERVRNLAAGVN